MYQVEYLNLFDEFQNTGLSAELLIPIVDSHNLKVQIFHEFGSTPEKRAAAFGQLRFKIGPEFTNSVMWYTVCEAKPILACTYPLIKKESQVFLNRYEDKLLLILAPFV